MADDLVAHAGGLAVYWVPGRRVTRVEKRRGPQGAPGTEAVWEFTDQDAEDLVAAVMVTKMREGPPGVARLLREVFDPVPRSNIAAGMFYAEVRSYRRVNGMIVRDMET